MKNDEIICPLVDTNITIDDCMENRETREESIPQKYKQKENWREICTHCKYYDY